MSNPGTLGQTLRALCIGLRMLQRRAQKDGVAVERLAAAQEQWDLLESDGHLVRTDYLAHRPARLQGLFDEWERTKVLSKKSGSHPITGARVQINTRMCVGLVRPALCGLALGLIADTRRGWAVAQANEMFPLLLNALQPRTAESIGTIPSRISTSLAEEEHINPTCAQVAAPALRELENVTSWYGQYGDTDPQAHSVSSSFATLWYTQLSIKAMLAFVQVDERVRGDMRLDALRELTSAAHAVAHAVSVKSNTQSYVHS